MVINLTVISSVVRQKANLKTGVTRKQSKLNFLKNEHFLSPNTQGGKKWGKRVRSVRFSENLACFVFL